MKWISVEDRLPEMGVVVLTMGAYFDPITAYKTVISWYEYAGADEHITGVTYWAELPPPPEDM